MTGAGPHSAVYSPISPEQPPPRPCSLSAADSYTINQHDHDHVRQSTGDARRSRRSQRRFSNNKNRRKKHCVCYALKPGPRITTVRTNTPIRTFDRFAPKSSYLPTPRQIPSGFDNPNRCATESCFTHTSTIPMARASATSANTRQAQAFVPQHLVKRFNVAVLPLLAGATANNSASIHGSHSSNAALQCTQTIRPTVRRASRTVIILIALLRIRDTKDRTCLHRPTHGAGVLMWTQ